MSMSDQGIVLMEEADVGFFGSSQLSFLLGLSNWRLHPVRPEVIICIRGEKFVDR